MAAGRLRTDGGAVDSRLLLLALFFFFLSYTLSNDWETRIGRLDGMVGTPSAGVFVALGELEWDSLFFFSLMLRIIL